MKRIFSFTFLLLITFVGIFHNPMMTFSMYQMDMGSESGMNCNIENQENSKKCNMSCCLDTTTIQANSIIVQNNFKYSPKDFKLKILINFSSIDYYRKNYPHRLIPVNSPPQVLKSIKNYSYHVLTGIIKSTI